MWMIISGHELQRPDARRFEVRLSQICFLVPLIPACISVIPQFFLGPYRDTDDLSKCSTAFMRPWQALLSGAAFTLLPTFITLISLALVVHAMYRIVSLSSPAQKESGTTRRTALSLCSRAFILALGIGTTGFFYSIRDIRRYLYGPPDPKSTNMIDFLQRIEIGHLFIASWGFLFFLIFGTTGQARCIIRGEMPSPQDLALDDEYEYDYELGKRTKKRSKPQIFMDFVRKKKDQARCQRSSSTPEVSTYSPPWPSEGAYPQNGYVGVEGPIDPLKQHPYPNAMVSLPMEEVLDRSSPEKLIPSVIHSRSRFYGMKRNMGEGGGGKEGVERIPASWDTLVNIRRRSGSLGLIEDRFLVQEEEEDEWRRRSAKGESEEEEEKEEDSYSSPITMETTREVSDEVTGHEEERVSSSPETESNACRRYTFGGNWSSQLDHFSPAP